MPNKVFLAVIASLTLATACGGGGSTKASSSSSSGSGIKGGQVKLVLLASKAGQDPVAEAAYYNGFKLAIDDLNAKGGIGGKPVEMKQFAAPPGDLQVTATNLQKSYDENPTGIIGLSSSSVSVPLGKQVDAGKLPFLYLSSDPAILTNGSSGSKWGFVVRPRDPGQAAAEAQYAVTKFKVRKAGLICVNSPYGTNGCDAIEKVLKDNKVQIVARRTSEPTATDMTSQVRAMRGADVVFDQTYPSTVGLAANQLIENGITAKHFDAASAGYAVQAGTIKKNSKALANLYSVNDCLPSSDQRSSVQAWVRSYKQRYGDTPNYGAAETYDAVMFFASAVKKAGSTDPAAIDDAMRSITYDGICTSYKSDAHQDLHHGAVMASYNPDGTAHILQTVTIPDPDA